MTRLWFVKQYYISPLNLKTVLAFSSHYDLAEQALMVRELREMLEDMSNGHLQKYHLYRSVNVLSSSKIKEIVTNINTPHKYLCIYTLHI